MLIICLRELFKLQFSHFRVWLDGALDVFVQHKRKVKLERFEVACTCFLGTAFCTGSQSIYVESARAEPPSFRLTEAENFLSIEYQFIG